ncbi:hypothetical protein F5884DRAFT_888646 [Xylogone sp. PMI_703]|nr:hypothetical protein F5884DRAFT_888646 [Xylogone sp. PMI_703]
MEHPLLSPSPPPSSSTTKAVTPPKSPPPAQLSPPKVASLSQADLSIVRRTLQGDIDIEIGIHGLPRFGLFSLNSQPGGLYQEVVRSRAIAQFKFLITTFLFNFFLVLQVVLGAAITALGPGGKNSTSITIIAACNTVNAGLLALMHNSGLPDRFKNDCSQFNEVEMYIWELMETGIVKEGWERDEVIADCFERYARAQRVVENNKPAAYVSSTSFGQANSSS